MFKLTHPALLLKLTHPALLLELTQLALLLVRVLPTLDLKKRYLQARPKRLLQVVYLCPTSECLAGYNGKCVHSLSIIPRALIATASSPMSNVPRRLQKFPEGAFKRIRQLRFRRDKKSGMIAVVMDFGGQKVMHPSYAHSVASSPFAQFMITKIAPVVPIL